MPVSSILFSPAVGDLLLLISILFTLGMAAYAGKLARNKKSAGDTGEATIISGATLSLSGLLIGFVFSISISGYSVRGQAQVNEALAIGKAWQYTSLLDQSSQQPAKALLKVYLDHRIHFFVNDSGEGKARSRKTQRLLWNLATDPEVRNRTGSMIGSVLSAYNDLSVSEQKTEAEWRRQIPNAAWAVLMLFAVCSSFLTGYQYYGKQRRHFFVLMLPSLMALALFMIAEIDIPGKGIIRVTPNDLKDLYASIVTDSLS
ncbi:hypothetical protein ACGVWS_02355 [Enterobacteriaceae bacterium LUAb1]